MAGSCIHNQGPMTAGRDAIRDASASGFTSNQKPRSTSLGAQGTGIGIGQEFTNRYRYYERSTNRYRYRLNLLSINRLKLETLKLYEKALLSQYNLK